MYWLGVAFLVVASVIVVFFTWANSQTRKNHAAFTPTDVEAALFEVISPDSHTHDRWDLFLAWRIDDAYLESIRQRCLAICRDYPSVPGRDLSEEAEDQVRLLLEELRSRG